MGEYFVTVTLLFFLFSAITKGYPAVNRKQRAIFLKMKIFNLLLAAISQVNAITEVPLGISRQIYCETCHIMASELVKKLDELDGKGLTWDDEVIILDHICGKRNYKEAAKEYKFPVDKMVRSCQAFLNRHEDTLEEALVCKFHHKMGVWLCHELSDACSGVVRLNADSPEDNKLTDEAISKMIKDNLHKVKKPVVGFNPNAPNVKTIKKPVHSEL